MTTKTKAKSMPPPLPGDGPVIISPAPALPRNEMEFSPITLPWLTLERLLYALLLALALALRLWHLTDDPLSNAEAGQSLLAWQLYQGQPIAGGLYSPLLVTLQSLAFFLLGPGDAAARLPAVLLGSLLVVLPLTFRRQLGPKVCLLVVALLALSPTAIFLSRTVNGEIGAAAGALMLVRGLFNWAEAGRRRWLWLGAGGLALLLTAGPMAYSIVIIFAIILMVRWAYFKELWQQGWVLARASQPEPAIAAAAGNEENDQEVSAAAQNDLLGQPATPSLAPLYFFLLCLALLATAATFNLSGLSAVSSLLTDWLGRFSAQSRPDSGFNAVFVLTIYEPLLVLIGLAGLAYAILERDLLKETLASWFIGTIVLDVLMGGRPTGSVILPLVPLAFLAALALAELWSSLQREGSWGNEGLLLAAGLVIGTFAYIGLTGWLICNRPDDNIAGTAGCSR
ncbi:MAG: hypothetical protein U0401_20435 [Anaerolineae bacterium]